jgi:hypothetical protein
MKYIFFLLGLVFVLSQLIYAGDYVPSDGHIRSDGMGGYYTPQGHYRDDGMGGLYTPDGEHQRSDGMGGWYQ